MFFKKKFKDVLSKKEYMKKEIDEIKNIETPANASESRSIKSRIKKLRKNMI